jgi:TetR/AcrR family transcriptional regulator
VKPVTLTPQRTRRSTVTRPAVGATAAAAPLAFRFRARRPGPAASGPRPRAATAPPTRDSLFLAAATAFSTHGFDGVAVDDIARIAGVNKAMIYYHFKNKQDLYREVVRDMLRAMRAALAEIAERQTSASSKIEQFVQAASKLRESRPWFPPIMLREMSAGGPRLDAETLGLMRGVFLAFRSILDAGVEANEFRRVNPVLAYITIMGTLMMNAARERAAAEPGRSQLPMFAPVDRRELVAHIQDTALRMLAKC